VLDEPPRICLGSHDVLARRLWKPIIRRAGSWKFLGFFDQFAETDVWGKTLGIVGSGLVELCAARRLDLEYVIYNSRTRAARRHRKELHAYYAIERATSEAILSPCTYRSMATPVSVLTLLKCSHEADAF